MSEQVKVRGESGRQRGGGLEREGEREKKREQSGEKVVAVTFFNSHFCLKSQSVLELEISRLWELKEKEKEVKLA